MTPARLTLRQTARWGLDRPRRADSSTLNIGHINARSLIPKMDEVNRMLQEQDFDVLCISETWTTDPAQDRILVFPGYRIERRDRAAGPSGGRRAAVWPLCGCCPAPFW